MTGVTCLLQLALAAQQPQEEAVFRASTNLAVLRFHVVKNSKYVDGLRATDFVLTEDGKPRQITFFEGGSKAHRFIPLEVILLFDTSGSVTQPGLLDFLAFQRGLLDGMDNVHLSVYTFDKNVRRYCKPTRNVEILSGVFRSLLDRKTPEVRPERIPVELVKGRKADPNGGTWLYEAIIAAMVDAQKVSPSTGVTRTLVVFSDGLPTTNAKAEDAAAVAKEMDIPLYPVLIGHWRVLERIRQRHAQQAERNASRKGPPPVPVMSRDELNNLDMEEFGRLGEMTGGRSFDPREINPETLRQIIGMLQSQVLFEYVVGFSPDPSDGAGKKHKLEMKVASKETGKVLGGTRTLVH